MHLEGSTGGRPLLLAEHLLYNTESSFFLGSTAEIPSRFLHRVGAGIGHVRYPTTGTSLVQVAQPVFVTTNHMNCNGHSGSSAAGRAGIGHVRYPTAGSASAQEAQPFFVNSPLGIFLIHNGNVTNAAELREGLNSSNSFFNRHLRTDSDSEVWPRFDLANVEDSCSAMQVSAQDADRLEQAPL